LGKWEWAARCVEHDTSWTTGPRGVWHEAWQAAVVHQWEFAEIVHQPVNRLMDRSGAVLPTLPPLEIGAEREEGVPNE
jgi:hypothetical protein